MQNKNKIKYFYINILRKKKYIFLKDIKIYTLKEIEFILNDYLYKLSCKNKIINFLNNIALKKKDNLIKEIEKLKEENKKILNEKNILMLKNESENNKILFNLKRKINDLEFKNNCLSNELSNKNKIIKMILQNDNDLEYINDNIKTNMITNKMSIFKLKKILLDKGIIIKNQSKHNLKQEVNRWNNHKFERIADKIINLKLKK